VDRQCDGRDRVRARPCHCQWPCSDPGAERPIDGLLTASGRGLGDIELGAKFRFVQENGWIPVVGTFPLLELPAGNET